MHFKNIPLYSLAFILTLSSCSGKKEEEKTVYENTKFSKNDKNSVHLTEKQIQSVGLTSF